MANIVIVEDETIVALDIRQSLERASYNVAGMFSSAEEMLESLASLEADLVLMDIRLQGRMDGVQAAGVLRRDYGVPVVLLTAYADSETIARAKLTEPFGYLIKPFEERDLKTTIEIALYRHKLASKLEQSEARYRSFFEEDLAGAFVADPLGKVLACNQAFADLVGARSIADAMELDLPSLFLTPDACESFFTDLYARRKLKLIEATFVRRDKVPVNILGNIIGNFDKKGAMKEIKGYLIDTTERKRLEAQLRQSQKMEAIGRLAGGIAHDFNNLLTVIVGYSSMIKDKVVLDKSVECDLDGIEDAARKAATLTKQLLVFSKRQILNPSVVNVNELVHGLEKMLRRLLPEDVVLHLYAEATDAHIYIDASQIEQALINLVVNARDAMPCGGKMDIDCRNLRLTGTLPTVNGEAPPGTYVKISVKDDGVGVPPDSLTKIFEPFYTTKPGDKGTGLGLATVFGFVEQSRGFIQVESEVGKGSTFSLLLPIAQSDAHAETSTPAAPPATQGHEAILLVEDEDEVRSLVSRLLTMQGYEVFEASNPGEAILIYEQHVNKIDLLVSDIVMPHMDGHGLAERLRAVNPKLKILLMSGYPSHTLHHKIRDMTSIPFIQKPFEPTAFAHKVREILDA